ncbi:MAG: hypothetical protein DMF61_17885 [Blastocatellia bacterium AA13]|nr:MAG: hypothetical protein DMF61_17885 [Blastocatellia bacterium AA13]
MREVERICDQLERALHGNAWHGPSVMEVLAGVSPTAAAAKPLASAHSIWEIVNHIAAWERIARERILEWNIRKVSDEEDWPPVVEASESAWSSALEALKQTNSELRETIKSLDDSRLEETIGDQSQTAYYLLHGVVQHDLYHAGQIALLKKAFAAA